MASLKDIRKRISSVKSTRKITSAMKMVAAAKLRRAQDAAEASRPYAVKMNELITNLSDGITEDSSPLFHVKSDTERILIVIIGSDRGLCGGYNANLFRAANRYIRSQRNQGIEVTILPIGRKATQAYKKEGLPLWDKEIPQIIGHIEFKAIDQLSTALIDSFLEGSYDEVVLVFNEFVSAIASNQRIEPLLPLKPHELKEGEVASEAYENGQLKEHTFEPNKAKLLERLLPKSIAIQILTSFYEAEASEHGARMTAMDSATNNASDLIDKLTLEYNRARQASITSELVEIVSGAEALHG